MPFEQIQYSVDRGLALLTLNRPDTMNALSPEMGQEILDALEKARDDPEVKALVFTGTGRAFCGGANPRALHAARSLGKDFHMRWGRLHRTLRELPKPVMAAVNGAAVGGGLELATLCDIRVASDKARFGAGFIRMGSAPAAGLAYYLPRLIGMANALEIMWTARLFDAQEALRLGLVSYVVPHEELMTKVWELALPIVKGPSVAIGLTKTLAYRCLEIDIETAWAEHKKAMEIVAQTEDAKEGPRAWVEKREPLFKGR
ncbi:MAG: enoyl-CoA hydratase/isomerase family protein [Chloroflexota bacterium]